MSSLKTILIGAAGLAGVAALAAGGQVTSQEMTPPSWQTLVRCAEMSDDDGRLGCYDAAMRAAGFKPRPEAAAAEHRRLFGLSMPDIRILKKKSRQEGEAALAPSDSAPDQGAPAEAQPAPPAANTDQDEVTVVLEKVAAQGDGRLLFITTEGQIWEQIETETVALPKAGYAMPIRRNRFGGYFCDVSKYKTVRCKRDR